MLRQDLILKTAYDKIIIFERNVMKLIVYFSSSIMTLIF